MANEIKIICPSRKRAKSVHTKIDNLILLVEKKELKEYKKHNQDLEIITHDNLNSLSKIRQFVYDKFGDVFMVDDDIVSVERLYTTADSILSKKEVFNLIQDTYYNANSINAKLFGFNNDPSPTHYNQHKPFMLKGYINACAIGLIEDDNLFFNDNIIASEDFWISLLNSYYNRYNFIDKRFHFRQKTNSTFILKGGQAGKRTLSSEKSDLLILRENFGDSVQIKKTQNKTKALHQYQRILNVKL